MSIVTAICLSQFLLVDYTGKSARVNNTKIDSTSSKQDNKNKFAKKSTLAKKDSRPDNRSRTPERKADRKDNGRPFNKNSDMRIQKNPDP